MLPNIVDHSVQVKNVSIAIYEHLKSKDIISRELLVAAALLHDIAKTRSIKNREMRHDLIGGEMLRELGFDEIADIVENHVVFSGYEPEGPLTEKEIIYYADKRVMHDKIVSVHARVDDLVHRYGINEKIKEMIIRNREFVLDLESKIARHMTVEIDTALKGL
ncbi:MAG TPA: HDIG domain-containing protein [Spirochaetota bacterium]|nr:HDIG domain-containing protein [Spirochaetota bacterium]HPJ35949.1 HDIG domain-containing protein [Spirochaetota bacterium]